ncbi:Biopolymer transport protein ExbD/TolR [Desulfurobacterium thermolithotrophum DSM 11699]|uniref:Biopolymer transport protein ExbD/TolR n=1 Tax=Desulfurobacterium thermolithotrophum (strain DSM 11699 / BSA) TaxID=868864 RepID=F0S3I5_DESTD|nr:biopolymer transporter ExbD [Desulfurobacterium thermolithotrophum]ADY73407.1 Biopolymer transport protein ExbD/TolR [Desulfurobacterium thermolithotrophum DSM 11699]
MQIREKKKGFIADISLSPILDLSLMLVIFLAVTTEFISGGEIKVQVPKGGAAISSSSQIVKLIVDKWGKIYYKGKVYSDPAKLVSVLPKDENIYIKADKETPYLYVFTLLDTLRKSGIKKVSLVGQRVE